MRIEIRIPPVIRSICKRIESAGGQSVLVGGAVLDALAGREPKDWDIEVFRLGYDELKPLLKDLGPTECGKAFGILKLSGKRCAGLDIDISVPRSDNFVGKGDQDFGGSVDPRMTFAEAARRRDFTINAMGLDLTSLEILDPYGGLRDRETGVLRATDPETFVQDPLRALRAMQLLPRKATSVDPSTMRLIRGLVDTFPSLPKERVYEEWRKLLLKAPKPSVGLKFLRESGWLRWFPELGDLIGCEQRPEWHPEGDVWTHTLYVADASAEVRDKVDAEWREAFVFGCMLHDVGKPATTVTQAMVDAGRYPAERLLTAYGHDREGMAPAENFLRRITNNKALIERSVTIVKEHMQPFNLYRGQSGPGGWRRLHGRIRLDVIGWVNRCDCCGRPDHSALKSEPELQVSEHCFARFEDLGNCPEPVAPTVLGRHLIAAGVPPGPAMGPALQVAYEAQLDDDALTFDALMALALSRLEVAPGGGTSQAE